MPDDPYLDELADTGERLRRDSHHLRDLSRRLLAEIDALRSLELESRRVPTGSFEFKTLSAEIETRARRVFRMTEEQNQLAGTVEPQDRTLEDLDQAGELGGQTDGAT